MLENVYYHFMRPAIVALVAAVLTGGLIFLIGESLLKASEQVVDQEYERKVLWLGVALTVGILTVAGLLTKIPAGKLGLLDDEVAIGSKPMFPAPTQLTPLDPYLVYGPAGAVADLGRGYTLYAASGALAQVLNVLNSVEDFNSTPRTLIYAEGLNGVNPELWIPVEAVTRVYPETKTAFLAIRGDEVEPFGWHNPPASWVRRERPEETPLY